MEHLFASKCVYLFLSSKRVELDRAGLFSTFRTLTFFIYIKINILVLLFKGYSCKRLYPDFKKCALVELTDYTITRKCLSLEMEMVIASLLF